jgi:hypothetical protein
MLNASENKLHYAAIKCIDSIIDFMIFLSHALVGAVPLKY